MRLGQSEQCLERPAAVTQRSSACYRHWPFRCCSSPAAAAKRGARVRVILDRRARSVNSGAYSYLGSHKVKVTWSSPDYRYTHQKTMIIDGAKAVIMTANLTSRYYATSRDFMVIDTERADVSAITAVFDADFARKAVRPRDGSDLV